MVPMFPNTRALPEAAGMLILLLRRKAIGKSASSRVTKVELTVVTRMSGMPADVAKETESPRTLHRVRA